VRSGLLEGIGGDKGSKIRMDCASSHQIQATLNEKFLTGMINVMNDSAENTGELNERIRDSVGAIVELLFGLQ